MKRFSLNIYGNNDEIVKVYETDRVFYGLIKEVITAQKKLKSITAPESLSEEVLAVLDTMIIPIIKKLFLGITDEELACAELVDIMSTFQQLTNLANTGELSKLVGGK